MTRQGNVDQFWRGNDGWPVGAGTAVRFPWVWTSPVVGAVIALIVSAAIRLRHAIR